MYQSLYENEALEHLVADGARRLNLQLDTSLVLDLLTMEIACNLHHQALQVLEQDDLKGVVERELDQSPPNRDAGYGMRLRTDYQGSTPNAMTFYRIKDSWQANCLSLAGLALALASASPSAVVPAASLLLNTWNNLVILRRPEDAAQLDAYESMVRAKVMLVQKKEKRDPSVIEIHAISINPSSKGLDETNCSLNRLRVRGLSEVSHWGNASLDYDCTENQWRPKL